MDAVARKQEAPHSTATHVALQCGAQAVEQSDTPFCPAAYRNLNCPSLHGLQSKTGNLPMPGEACRLLIQGLPSVESWQSCDLDLHPPQTTLPRLMCMASHNLGEETYSSSKANCTSAHTIVYWSTIILVQVRRESGLKTSVRTESGITIWIYRHVQCTMHATRQENSEGEYRNHNCKKS